VGFFVGMVVWIDRILPFSFFFSFVLTQKKQKVKTANEKVKMIAFFLNHMN